MSNTEFARLQAYGRAKRLTRTFAFNKPSKRQSKMPRTLQHKRNRKAHERDVRLSAMLSLNNNLV